MSSESSDKVILRTPADWPRWFANIRDQANYKHIWEYINPDATATATATGSSETAETATGDTGTVTATPGTLPLEPSVTDKASDSSFKIQLETYRRWKKKVKAIKSLDSLIIQTLGSYFAVVENCISLYEKLKALKADVAPTDYACVLEVKKKYAALQTGPARN